MHFFSHGSSKFFCDDSVWSVGCGYLWKSMKDRILGTLNLHMLGKSVCHMATSTVNVLGYSEVSCVPFTTPKKQINGFRSWELQGSEENLILITLKYKLTVQTFSQFTRNDLRNNGFFVMSNLNQKDRKRLDYIWNKRLKTGYTHEKGFEKLLRKVKSTPDTRVKSISHDHTSQTDTVPSAPPSYESSQ